MASNTAPKIDPLTSLRFFAAAAIVISHAKGHFACLDGIDNRLVLSQGVTFFFVLSGFILALVYPTLGSGAEVFSYLVKRIARIWPLHITTLLMRLLILPAYLFTVIGPLPQSLAVFSNVFLLQAWVPMVEFCFSANPVSWTISTELFFYLCLPWLLVLASKKKWLPIAITGGITIAWIALCNLLRLPAINMITPSLQTMLYVNPAPRLLEFAVGVTAAFLFRDYVAKWKLSKSSCTAAEVAVVGLTAAFMWQTNAIAGALSSIRLIGSAGGFWLGQTGAVILPFFLMVLVFARNGGLLSSFLSLPLFVLLGEISYAIYLFHHPLLSFRATYLTDHRSVLDFAIFVGILITSSYLLYSLIETPCRKLGANLVSGVAQSGASATAAARLTFNNCKSYFNQVKSRVATAWNSRIPSPSGSDDSPNLAYSARLDHLRFLAAFMILSFHSFHSMYNLLAKPLTSATAPVNPLSVFIIEGHTAVGLFLTLSGFLFARICRSGFIDFKQFYLNRLLRVYPLYCSALIFSTLALPASASIPGLLTSLSSFSMLPAALKGMYVDHLWTIGVELQFYALFPLLLLSFRKSGFKALFQVLALSALVLTYVQFVQGSCRELAYGTIVGRLNEAVIGMILGFSFDRFRKYLSTPITLAASLGCVSVALMWLHSIGGHQGTGTNPLWTYWLLVEGLLWGAVICCYQACNVSLPNALSKPLARLGSMSYSIYVVHLPLVYALCSPTFLGNLFAPHAGLKFLMPMQLYLLEHPMVTALISGACLVLPATLLVALLTFNVIERPFMRLRRKYVLHVPVDLPLREPHPKVTA